MWGVKNESGEIIPFDFTTPITKDPAMVFMLLEHYCSIMTIPENDVMGAVTELIMHYLSGQLVPYMEYYEFFEDSMLIGVPDYVPQAITDGDVTVLPAAFGEFFNCGIFNMLYCKNSNVFAAVPSMHSAYVPVALYYAFVAKRNYLWIAVLLFVSVGIWFSAVYSGHHYIIDVILGALCAVIGLLLFEFVLLKIKSVSHLYERVANYLD